MASPAQHSLAILDDYAGIAEKHFSSLPNLHVESFPSTLSPKDPSELPQLITRLQPFTILSTMRERTPLPASLLSHLPNLKLVLTTGVRNASIDLPHCTAHNITVGGTRGARPAYYDSDGHPIHTSPSREGTPDAATERVDPTPPGYGSTTQHGMALLLSLAGRILHDDSALKTRGAWQSGLSVSLAGKTLGLVGLGKLGAALGRACVLALGMKVVAWSSSLTQDGADAMAEKMGLDKGTFLAVGKRELFEKADVVSLHYVLSERSRGIVGREEIAAMKRGALFVNTARGQIVDEDALYEALVEGRIGGAALDVFWSREPLEADSKWRTTQWGQDGRAEVVLSPHMGYVNRDTMETWYAEQADDVRRFLQGKDVGVRLA